MSLTAVPDRPRLVQVADEINIALERHFWLLASLFVAVLLGASIAKDLAAKMWYDELITLRVAQQASPGEIIQATLEGADGAPPLYAIVVHVILPWVRHEALAVRLPSTLGYCGMFLLLLAFCRPRLPALYCWVAALLACQACQYYSTEGRVYGVMLCSAAGALLCWQSAADGRRRILAIPLLAFCLALMTALHYYALLFCVPLFLAEMARWRASGKLDFPVLAAVVPVLLVLGLHYPLIAASKPFQEHSVAPAGWDSILVWYLRYFFLELCVLPLCALAMFWRMPGDRDASQVRFTLSERAAICAFTLMPLCAVVPSIFTTHTFLDRYVLWAVPGAAVWVSARVAARGKTAVGVTLLGLVLAVTAAREAYSFRARLALSDDGETVRRELELLPRGSAAIVVGQPHMFMELSYYAPSPLRERLLFPISRSLFLRYSGADTDALLMSGLSRCTNLHIVAYDTLLATHRRFLLAAAPSASPKDYLPGHLVTIGYRVVPIGSSRPPVLYEVTAPE